MAKDRPNNQHSKTQGARSSINTQMKKCNNPNSSCCPPPANTPQQTKESAHAILSLDNVLLFLFTCMVMYVGCTYQKLMNLVYSTEQWHFFDHVIKVYINYFNFPKIERDLFRNLIFNTVRCMPEELIMYIVYGTVPSNELIAFRLISIWILTIFVQSTTDTRCAERNPNKWACAIIFYVTSYGIQFTKAISICELTHNGDLSSMFVLTFLLIMGYLQGDMLEDFMCGDLNRLGGIWHNWSFFMPPYAIIGLGYALMHQIHGHSEHGAWRDPSSKVYDFVSKTGQVPMAWPSVMFEENEFRFYEVVLMANLVYGLTTYYY